MVNYKKFNVLEAQKKRQAQAKELLNDFMKDHDIKQLVALFFENGFQAGMFGVHPHTDTLILDFPFGKYEYRLLRQPLGAGKMAQKQDQNIIIQNVLKNTVEREKRADALGKLSPRRF